MASRGGATRPNGPNAGNKICQFKLVLLGESAVGKSSLVLRFVKGQFHEFQESTIGGEGGGGEQRSPFMWRQVGVNQDAALVSPLAGSAPRCSRRAGGVCSSQCRPALCGGREKKIKFALTAGVAAA